jgi:hypothetical protein
VNNKIKLSIFVSIIFIGLVIGPCSLFSQGEETKAAPTADEMILDAMHGISSHKIMSNITELCSEKYGGRLTGTPAYDASAQWIASLLSKWNISPGGDNNTYFQKFPNPYTLVLDSGSIELHIPYKNNTVISKTYKYQTDFFPGSTSGSGKVEAEVVYVGYGITAPELNFDEYKGLNVKGKIVMVEREVPISPSKEPEEFKKWQPYSYHQYKVKNAKDHGAAGMLYVYHITNPNCLYIDDLILTYVGKEIVEDIFTGTGRTHEDVIKRIEKKRKPQSFNTKKTVTISNATEHHPDGMGSNVIGIIEGSDPDLKNEAIILGAHLDHLGYNHLMMPGANDNASGVAVIMGVAEAISQTGLKPKRTVIFIFFGAEEQGVKGSAYYLEHPVVPNTKVVGFLNLDGVGRGKKIMVLAGKNYPELWNYIEAANSKYVHRVVKPLSFQNLARPRLDAARFMSAGIPSLSFAVSGAKPLPYETYHTTNDRPEILEPEIMEDLAQVLFIATMELARY